MNTFLTYAVAAAPLFVAAAGSGKKVEGAYSAPCNPYSFTAIKSIDHNSTVELGASCAKMLYNSTLVKLGMLYIFSFTSSLSYEF